MGDKTILADDPLPPDYRSRIRAASERIAAEVGADPAVRSAARCLRRHFGPLPPEPVDPSTIGFAAVCERKFRVTNRGRKVVILLFDVAGYPGRTKVGVPVGDSFIVTEHPGLARLYDGDRVITSANSSQQRCPVVRGKP